MAAWLMTRRRGGGAGRLPGRVGLWFAAFGVAAAMSACGSPGADLPPVPLPNLSSVDATVRERIETQHASLVASLDERSAETLSAAFGEMGKLFMAAEFWDEAAVCFENAATLVPSDARWPYYLAHAERRRGDLASAAAAFERVLAVEPTEGAASWWLGSVYLELGRPQEAESLFSGTQTADGFSLPALYGLGRAALAREDYETAAGYLERVLAIDAAADAAHYPLGLAYRELDRLEDAEMHLKLRSDQPIEPRDPLMAALGGLLDTAVQANSRGVQASRQGVWPEAVTHFRRAVDLDPRNTSAHLNLGVALQRTGDTTGALAQARQALQIAPGEARAHFVLGTIMAVDGRDAEAIEQFTSAAELDERFIEASLSLAHAFRRTGRVEEAADWYARVLTRAPGQSEALFGSALSFVRLRRYLEARDQLNEGMRSHPEELRFAHALARVLASAPDASARNGEQALAMIEELMQSEPTIERAVTMAMALAETGQFEAAAAWQNEAIAAAEREGLRDELPRMRTDLGTYQQGRPNRTPWDDDNPIHFPAPEAPVAVR